MSIRRLVFLAALAAAGLVTGIGCVGEGGDESSGEEGGTGMARVAISEVPSDGSVGCIQVTATGDHTVTRSEDVAPGQSTVLHLKGLPVGTVSFTGDAFPGPCAGVTPTSAPTWIGDPVLASVNNVHPVDVQLVMRRNGKAAVDVDFQDEPACAAAGAPCLDGAECCSQSCTAGACDGAPPGCQSALDCPAPAAECQVAVCLGGACGVADAPAGTPVSTRTAGDCAVLECDGAGGVLVTPDDTDVASDGDECTLDVCDGGLPTHPPAPAGTPCNQDGGSTCDGAGNCL